MEEGVGFVDMWLNFVGRGDFFMRGGLHLTGKGAAVHGLRQMILMMTGQGEKEESRCGEKDESRGGENEESRGNVRETAGKKKKYGRRKCATKGK